MNDTFQSVADSATYVSLPVALKKARVPLVKEKTEK